MGQARTTTDHEGIKRWIEEGQGRPTVVEGTEGQDGEDLLRVDFREPDGKLEKLSWDGFFQTFEGRKPALLHRDQTKDGEPGRLFEFVKREA